MAEVLYRKYRPNNFAQVEGQEHVIPILKESILQGKISHAYLFCGPRGCGKTTIARIMAKAVNCENFSKLGDICNECEYCQAINNNSVDIIEMDAASNRGIEEIRAVRDTVNFVPNFLKKKIYIIDEAHMLTKEAFNALLKTLEEPPEHVVFIMATTEAHKLPVTILSRVTRFDFKLGTQKEVTSKLKMITESEGYSIDSEGLNIIYKASGGSFRDSESLLTKIIISSGQKNISKESILSALGITDIKNLELFVEAFEKKDLVSIRTILTQVVESDGNVVNFLEQLLQFLNDGVITDASKGTINNNYLDLANLVISFKGDLRDFNDKLTVLILEFIKYFNSLPDNGNLSNSHIEVKKEIAVVKQSVTEPKVIKSIEPAIIQKSNSGGAGNLDSFIEAVASRSEGVLPRLKGVLKTSKITIDGSEIKIANPYKFNLAYLSKKESRDIFTSVGESVYGKKMGLSFSISNEVPIVENTDNSAVIEIENDVKIEEPKKEKIDKTVDNSNLVEEIF